MGEALRDMLPYASGLLVSPLPVAAVIMLLVSSGGQRKATVFEIAWLIVSFLLVVGLAALVASAPPRTDTTIPAWEAAIVIVLGTVLLVLAAVVWRVWRRQKNAGGDPEPPTWMRALDTLTPGKVAALAAVLIVANPVNASMLIAAAVELGHHRLPATSNLLPAAVFVVVGSLTVLLPYAVTLIAGRKAGLLPTARRWLLRYNSLLTFWMTLIFGLAFLVKGLRALL